MLTQVKPYTDVLQALQECLHLRDNAAAARLARQEPQLLCCVPARFKGVVSALMQLSMPFEHARQLVSQAPYILAMNPASLHSNIRMLLGTFQLDRQAVASMAVQLPGLLAASPGVFAISCQRLKRTAYGSAAWRPQLLKLVQQPRNLAVAVSFDSSR